MISITTAWDQPYRPLYGDHAAALMIELQPGATSRKLPVAVHVLLDISGSMNSNNKLEKSKEACNHIIEQLEEEDSMSITAFNHECEQVVQNSLMNPRNKQAAKDAVAKLKATSVTLLEKAFQNFTNSHKKNQGVADYLFLISDGRPTNNKGVPVDDFANYLESAKRIGTGGVTMIAVALGDPKDYDAGFFNQLAETTGGSFRYSPQAEDLKSSIQDDLQVMQNTAVKDLQLEISFNEPTTRLMWFGRAYPDKLFFESSTAGHKYRVGHLSADQPQTFLAYIMSSAGFDSQPGRKEMGRITISSDSSDVQNITQDVAVEYSDNPEHLNFVDHGVRRWRLELDETSQTKKAMDAKEQGDTAAFDRHIQAAKKTRSDLDKPIEDLEKLKGTRGEDDEDRLARILTEARKSRRPDQ